jgi:hypothetical protein
LRLPDILGTYPGLAGTTERRAILFSGAAFGALAVIVCAIIAINTFVPGNLYSLTPSFRGWKHLLSDILVPRLLPLLPVLLVALLVAAQVTLAAGPQVLIVTARVAAFLDRHGRVMIGLLLVLSMITALFVALVVLRSFPSSADEYHMQFQARTFLEGRLWQDLPQGYPFFSTTHVLERGSMWISHYPPGWPLVVGVGLAVGIPPVVMGPLSSVAMLAALATLARAVLGWVGAVIVCTLVVVSGFFLLNAGSYFNHVFTAFLMLGFTIFARRFLGRPGAADALAAGAFIGMLGINRYYSALLCFLPFLASLIGTLSWRHYRAGLWALLTIAPFLAGLLAYNHAVTGSALTTVTSWAYPAFRLGLWAVTEGGMPTTPLHGAGLAAIQLTEFMEWTSPLALAAYVMALGYLIAERKARFYDFYFVVFVLGFLLYADIGGNRYGPRYYFEPYPFLVLTVTAALFHFAKRARNWRLTAFLVSLCFAHLIIAACSLPAFLFYMNRMTVERMDLYDQVAAAGLDHAVVFVKSGTGLLRPMPVGDLTRNGTRIEGPVIYAHDLGERNAELVALFPDRTFWRYERQPSEVRGRLEPWRPNTASPP